MYKRVMIKISGEALLGDTANSYNRGLIEALANEIKEISEKGVQTALVTGAGNYWRGARSDARVDRVASDNMGMLATAMNAIYISDCFCSLGVKNVVMSSVQIGYMFDVFSKQNALDTLSDGKVIIFAYGTGHPYFSTDTATALYGSEIDADIILALKFGVDGVYTKDPKKYPKDAAFIERISYDEIISNNEVNVIDKAAACICRESGLKTIVLNFEKGNILKAVNGEKIGTMCENTL